MKRVNWVLVALWAVYFTLVGLVGAKAWITWGRIEEAAHSGDR